MSLRNARRHLKKYGEYPDRKDRVRIVAENKNDEAIEFKELEKHIMKDSNSIVDSEEEEEEANNCNNDPTIHHDVKVSSNQHVFRNYADSQSEGSDSNETSAEPNVEMRGSFKLRDTPPRLFPGENDDPARIERIDKLARSRRDENGDLAPIARLLLRQEAEYDERKAEDAEREAERNDRKIEDDIKEASLQAIPDEPSRRVHYLIQQNWDVYYWRFFKGFDFGARYDHATPSEEQYEPCVLEFLKQIYATRLSRRKVDTLLQSFEMMVVGLGMEPTNITSWKRLDLLTHASLPSAEKIRAYPIHVCPKECLLFLGPHLDKLTCENCSANR